MARGDGQAHRFVGVLSRCCRPRPSFSSTSRCQGSGPLSPASAVPGRPQGKANMHEAEGIEAKAAELSARGAATAETSITVMMAHALAGGIEQGDVVDGV